MEPASARVGTLELSAPRTRSPRPDGVLRLIDQLRPAAIVHSAAQPSHDLAAKIPYEDFDTNAVGTMNLLEAVHRFVPASPFVHMSANKVYGDAPNELPLIETETRWEYARPEDCNSIRESMRIDQSKHLAVRRIEGCFPISWCRNMGVISTF